MKIHIAVDKQAAGGYAAAETAQALTAALDGRGSANLILATGASQFEMLGELVKQDIDWHRVTCFHLDEYVGMPDTHPASFRRYLKERFCDRIDGPKAFHWIGADDAEPAGECERLASVIEQHPIDVACIGIGENGHLAFNDPPADFDTEVPYLVVELDEACRRQQLGEGWFASIEEVPTQAISMSVRHILKSRKIVCTVPDERKATAVRNAVEGIVTAVVPASILQQHSDTTLVLDQPAASYLSEGTRAMATE